MNFSISSRKRALLIGSPFGDLCGPLNDVELMATVLEEQGFENDKCCGVQATCDNIRVKWGHLINESSASDAVVIYFSGHGGIADCGLGTATQDGDYNDKRPRGYQFIVPMDFDQANEGRDFRGILDVELSQLLKATTEKTKNVTLILDCCHSGRIKRQPGHGDQARPKSLPRVYHHDISGYIEQCRSQGRLLEETHLEGNPHAVRITAAATTESAFEYTNPAGKVYGAMTEILASAIREGYRQDVSWRTTLMRVRESVNVNFPQQHPRAEGPDTRLHFSIKQLDPSRTRNFVLKVEAGRPILRAGRIAGVHRGDTYAIIPLGSKDTGALNKIADAVVTNVYSSYSELDLNSAGSISMIPEKGSMACLQHEALPRWPVMLSAELGEFRPALADSRFLRCIDATQEDPPLMTIRQDADQILLSTNLEIDIASVMTREEAAPSQEEFLQIVKKAEHLARAQHLLSIQNGHKNALQHKVVVDVGWINDGRPGENRLEHNGGGCLTEDDRIFIKLANRGHSTVYVSVFDTNVTGTITLISASSPGGIELEAGRTYTLGKNQFDESHGGLKISWPKDVPKSPGVNEWLVFVFSSSPADLRHLVNPATPRNSKHGPLSRLEKLVDWISFGNRRDIEKEVEEDVRFTVSQIPFLLRPQSIPAIALPTADQNTEWIHPSNDQSGAQPTSKGIFGAIVRSAQGIPPCVWVVNQHNEEITVVVSRYRPDRLLSSVGVTASAHGAGLDFSTTAFTSPATQKTLQPSYLDHKASVGQFPLWTRKEGFGVITIFKGSGKTLFLENDQIPLGSTAFFEGNPDLKIVRHKPKELLWDRYSRTGSTDDLEQAIAHAQEAVIATPLDHPDRAGRLNNLGLSLRDRYSRTGSMNDLEQAFALVEEAVKATPSDHPDQAMFLVNLERYGKSLVRTTFRVALEANNVEKAILVLEKEKEAVTQATFEFEWIKEPLDMGLTPTEIVSLIIEERDETPWIRYDLPLLNEGPMDVTFHRRNCVHDPVLMRNSPGRQDQTPSQEAISRITSKMCGLGGVIPALTARHLWEGSVTFSDAIATVSYQDTIATNVFLGSSEEVRKLTRRSLTALNRITVLVAWLQRHNLICERFVVISSAAEIESAQTVNIPIRLVKELKSHLEKVLECFDVGDTSQLEARLLGTSLELLGLFCGSDLDLDVKDYPDPLECAIESSAMAVQAICLGMLCFSTANIGQLDPFFLMHSVSRIELCGIGATLSTRLLISLQLTKLSCIGDMLGGPVMAFSCDKQQLSAARHNLLTSFENLFEMWGPGEMIIDHSLSPGQNICGAVLGGGLIYQPSNCSSMFHWKQGAPEEGVEIFAHKIRVGPSDVITVAGFSVNPDCPFSQAVDKVLPRLDTTNQPHALGTFGEFWTLQEIQSGAQAGNYGIVTINLTWVKTAARTIKSAMISGDWDLNTLEAPWGLVVSVCSGVAQRVPIREVIAEVMPAMVAAMRKRPQEWDQLIAKGHDIVEEFRKPTFRKWYDSLQKPERDAIGDIAEYILRKICWTGVNHEEMLVVACPSGGNACGGIHMPREQNRALVSILKDSDQCATFACTTAKCIEAGGQKCRNSDHPKWQDSASLLITSVCQYQRLETEQWHKIPRQELQDGRQYWMGRVGDHRRFVARVRRDPGASTILELSASLCRVSWSRLALERVERIRRSCYIRLLKRHLVDEDDSEEVFVLSSTER